MTDCTCGTTACSCGTQSPIPIGSARHFAHSAIRARMLGRIARVTAFGDRPLATLGVRKGDDPAIALIDAAAGVAHVLISGLARLYRDGTITGSTDPAALARLTGTIGYQPRPAIAATTTLVFDLNPSTANDAPIILPAGLKVASIPLKDEMPVPFETDAAIETRPAWNALSAHRAPQPQTVSTTTRQVEVLGLELPARVGDMVLVLRDPPNAATPLALARITQVRRDQSTPPARTILDLAAPVMVGVSAAALAGMVPRQVILLGRRSQGFGASAPDPAGYNVLTAPPGITSPGTATAAWTGHTLDGAMTATNGSVYLESAVDEAVPDRLALFTAPDMQPALTTITSALGRSRAGFSMSSRVTWITVTGTNLTQDSGQKSFGSRLRETLIHIETARAELVLPLANPQLPVPATPDLLEFVVDPDTPALPVGRRVVIQRHTDATADGSDAQAEMAVVAAAIVTNDRMTVTFTAPLQNIWSAAELVMRANAAGASQAESLPREPEVLGLSDANRRWQDFALSSSPLAFVPAPGPLGYGPALRVTVGGLQARQVASMAEDAAQDGGLAYTVAHLPGDKARVTFAGNLPSSRQEIAAFYRKGGGLGGNLAKGRLSMIMTPVPGLSAVTNPLPAEGGSDAETGDAMRHAAPLSIATLGRAVSLADFAAFATTFRGIGKARADELRIDGRRKVIVTIATTNLEPPVAGSTVAQDLAETLAAAAPPGTLVGIEGFILYPLAVTLATLTDPALDRSKVELALRQALLDRFGRQARPFSLGLHRSELLAAAQAVPGVLAARLDGLAAQGLVEDVTGRLLCPSPGQLASGYRAAGLLALDDAGITLTEMIP